MSEFDDSACIAYPASWPDTIKDPHSTLIYLGEISKLSYTKEDVLEVMDQEALSAPGAVEIDEIEMFGPDKDIPVAKLTSLRLKAQRAAIEFGLAEKGIHSTSEFGYNPHVSLTYDNDVDVEELELPETVTLAPPELWWGDERL